MLRCAMRRALSIVLAIAACSKTSDGPSRPADRDSARPAAADAAAAEPGEPTVPPPEPTVRSGGKGDCKTDHAPRPTRDPNPMCKVAGGEFTMGTAEKDLPDRTNASNYEVPAHRVVLSPYHIDQFEVTVGQVIHFLNAAGDNRCETRTGLCFPLADSSSSPISLEAGTYRAAPDTERLPFGMASFEGASKYCAWAGKRLPTEAEWELAARHDPATGVTSVFPWGDSFEPMRCNCADEDSRDGFAEQAPVGSFDGTDGRRDGSSPTGVHDLSGNAPEIVADCFARYSECKEPCRDPRGPEDRGCQRVERGGAWTSRASRNRGAVRQPLRTSSGFRCAR